MESLDEGDRHAPLPRCPRRPRPQRRDPPCRSDRPRRDRRIPDRDAEGAVARRARRRLRRPHRSAVEASMTADDFRAWRAKHGLTQQAAAAALDVSLRTVQGYEAAKDDLPTMVELACKGWETKR